MLGAACILYWVAELAPEGWFQLKTILPFSSSHAQSKSTAGKESAAVTSTVIVAIVIALAGQKSS